MLAGVSLRFSPYDPYPDSCSVIFTMAMHNGFEIVLRTLPPFLIFKSS